MTDYTKTTDFAAKDSLPSGNAGKVIRGTEFETEFDNIAAAVATKIDKTGGTFTGTVAFNDVTITTADIAGLTVSGSTTLGDAATDIVLFNADIDSSLIPSVNNTHDIGAVGSQWKDLYLDGKLYVDSIEFNGTDITATAAEINYLDGVTSDIQTQLNNRLSKIGGTMTGDITMTTGTAINFGTNSELQIERTNTASIIRDAGTNNLFLLSNGDAVVLGTDDPTFVNSVRANIGGSVQLYHDGTETVTTTSTGVNIVGQILTNNIRLDNPTVPTSATDTGSAGSISWDANYIYVCVATNTWKRVAIATW